MTNTSSKVWKTMMATLAAATLLMVMHNGYTDTHGEEDPEGLMTVPKVEESN